MSIRRACRVLEMDRSSCHDRSPRLDQARLEARIKALSDARALATVASCVKIRRRL